MACMEPQENFRKTFECPICIETFKEPRVLPCGHTFCKPCLVSCLTRLTSQKDIKKEFMCPVCNAKTSLPDTMVCSDKWADNFPANYMIVSLLEIVNKGDWAKKCDVCSKRSKDSSPSVYCRECGQFLCDTCSKFHADFTVTATHAMININQIDEAAGIDMNLALLEKCTKHKEKQIEYFCNDHKLICCNACVMLEHRKCEQVTTIDEFLGSFNFSARSRAVKSNIHHLHNHLQTLINHVRRNMDTLSTEKTTAVEEIRQIKRESKVLFRDLEKRAISTVEGHHKSESMTLQMQEDSGTGLLTAIEADKSQLDLAMSKGSDLQKFIVLVNLELRQEKHRATITDYQQSLQTFSLQYRTNENLKDLMQNVKDLGAVTINRLKQIFSDCTQMIIVEEAEAGKRIESLKPVTPAVKKRKFNVKVHGDKTTCHISCVLQLPDSNLLLVDHDNNRLKVIGSENLHVTTIWSVNGKPWCATILKDEDIAITIPVKKTIQFVHFQSKMTLSREIHTRLECWGISALDNQLVVTTYKDKNAILILSLTGEELRTLEEDENIRRYPMYVSSNVKKTTVFVSYHESGKLVGYDTTLNPIFSAEIKKLNGVLGSDTDDEDNVYTCGFESGFIVKVSQQGNASCLIDLHNRNPLTIKVIKGCKKCIVTFCSSNTVEVYAFLT